MQLSILKRNKRKAPQQNNRFEFFSKLSSYLRQGSYERSLDFTVMNRQYTERDFIHAYETIMPLSTAVDMIADQIQAVDLKVYDKANKVYLDDHPVLSLLSSPNPFSSRPEFIHRVVTSWLVTGNIYFVISQMPGGEPIEIYNHLPQEVTCEKNQRDCYASLYRTTMCGAASGTFVRKEVDGWIAFINPLNNQELYHVRNTSMSENWRLHGLSKLNSIAYELTLYVLGTLYNQAFLKNQGRPSGAFSPRDMITDDQQAQLSEQIAAAMEGAHNAGRTLIMPVGMDYTEMSKTAREMEYSELLRMTVEAVYNRFNIPLALVQSSSLSLANMETAMTQLYTKAVLPVIDRITYELTRFLMPKYDDSENLCIWYDKREISALIPLQIEKLKAEKELDALSTNEIRQELNRDPVFGGDDVLAPANMVPIGSTIDNPSISEQGDDS